jgi:hypothetical protein
METLTSKKTISLRIPMTLYEHLYKRSREENRSFNNYIETTLMKASQVITEEDYTPNEETISAIEEGDRLVEQYKKGLIKAHTDIKQMFNDILTEDDE